jgi:general secretion pathway protein A
LILAYVEQVQQVTATMVETVAAELELDMQPFMLSSAALGNVGPPSPRSATEDNFIAAFNRETPGRQDR